MADESFSPEAHRFAEPRYFEDLTVGERFYIPSRTMTDAHFSAFQAASGDNHPILVAAQGAAGAGIFPHVIGDSLVAFLEQSSRFLRPVYVGDTLYPMLVITELTPGRTTGVVVMRVTIHNQDRELVMDGIHRYLLRKRTAASN
ncbi:MAG: dehydratase [Candidatus Rokuibacteriota bacterium]|nr:MAG: dehydratase [Candidatus Rokubacteria bacterium]